ncbi:uncharacterized protein CcaverHIS019_0310160 [Cutaneotrichosporon cavernicola]|uniref:HCP-like protein n=1 Tax=Cutaneotrichosporon cavernicola TaxID=279322 RepID=A0AA48IG04_9TREE|nr:uncharacterized protein CcaverHIS019_0310160 [Cutaneotrichosporon cavernicola]BEI90946.1 hypothetical protein CcaverHIS019_0310160 [Cutaneotrichosporon cavernicola]BEI98725.1 hypothetical protein CcaverHIS631_0310240 [Cutaneotrichosporon cavernicola]
MITRKLIILLLALALAFLALAEPILDESRSDVDVPEEDPCAGVHKAHDILQALYPHRHAHLSKKLGGSGQARRLPDELGWSSHGPLSAALRISSRLVASLNPLNLLAKIPRSTSRRQRISASTRDRIERVFAALDDAEAKGCPQALALRADVLLFPPSRGIKQDLPAAYDLYKRYLDLTSDSHAQFIVGFFHATGVGGVKRDQGLATLYYTFAALQGHKPAQMAMGYRYWAGIGVKEDCVIALDFYERAGEKAYNTYEAGPPGGETLPLSPSRISDRLGGVFGPHATWSLTGFNVNYVTVKAINALARGESEPEILEYLKYNSDRGQMRYTYRLGHHYYAGSVFPHSSSGVSSGAEEIGEIPQSFDEARKYFHFVARQMWPADLDAEGKAAPRKEMNDERRKELSDPAMVAASFLGRMYMRGEGVKKDFKLARLWYQRAADLGDRESHNGLGIMYRDGLGVKKDREKAFKFFQAAAGLDLPDAEINIGKMLLDKGDSSRAAQYFVHAVQHGSPFEAFYHLAALHSASAHAPADQRSPGACGVAVGYYKLVSEVGAWDDDYIGEANRAWSRGEEDKALLGWWIAAEMGFEIGQNNVAFMLNRGSTHFGYPIPADTELMLWTRSAAQGNADAMVMVGDSYYTGAYLDSSTDPNVTESLPDYPRAFGYYQTASEKHNPMAYWNLGYMYENGLGVRRDWHMAKRNYDMALNVSPKDAYLPWVLSLTKLYIRSWWTDVATNGDVSGLSLFDDSQEAPGLWEGIKRLFTGPLPAQRQEREREHEDDNEHEDYSGAGWDGNNDELDDVDDMVENVVILAVTVIIMLLFWLRQRWGQFGFGPLQQPARMVA